MEVAVDARAAPPVRGVPVPFAFSFSFSFPFSRGLEFEAEAFFAAAAEDEPPAPLRVFSFLTNAQSKAGPVPCSMAARVCRVKRRASPDGFR